MADLAPFSGITRIEPFTGLVIDPPTWGAAHEEHRLHQRLHLLGFHGTGIAQEIDFQKSETNSVNLYFKC